MRKIYLVLMVLLLCSTVTAGTYDKDIQIAAGDVGIDSVRLRVEVNNTKIDSALWTSFPVDSFITLPDTAILTISYWYYFSDDAGTFTTAYEQIQAHVITSVSGADVALIYTALDTSASPDTALQGVSISGYNMSDMRILWGTTDGNGEVTFGVKQNDSVYFNASQPVGWIWEQRDTVFLIQNLDTASTQGYMFSPAAPVAGKTAAVTVFVLNSDRTPAVGITVTAHLSRSNAVDSSGSPMRSQLQRKVTDSDGKVIFTCVWSSYLVPFTKWVFSSPSTGNLRKRVTIPRQTTFTVDFR